MTPSTNPQHPNPFDIEIKRIETIILYLGLELERHEDMLKETKIARLKQAKKG